MKKLLYLALISAMLLTFTACDKKGNSSDTSTENSQSNQTSNSESSSTSSEPVSTPGSGWTMEALAKTICVNGKNVSSPFTVDSLGSDYSVKYDGSYPYLVYNKKQIALLKFDEKATEKDDRQKKVDMISVFEEIENPALVSFNGVKYGSTIEEARLAIGEPTDETSEYASWLLVEDGKVAADDIFLNDTFFVISAKDDKITYIAFYFSA